MGYRKQLPIRTDSLNAMNNIPKRRAKKIEDDNFRSMQYRMSQATTPADKRAIVVEVNPLFYVFGETRKMFKPYQTYEENYE
jgi:hypothetical protein